MGSSTVTIVRDAVSKGCGVGEVAAVRVFKCPVSQNEQQRVKRSKEQRAKRSKGHRPSYPPPNGISAAQLQLPAGEKARQTLD